MQKQERRRRVVVTGLGCVSPVDNAVNETWEAIIGGNSGIAPITKARKMTRGAKLIGGPANAEKTARILQILRERGGHIDVHGNINGRLLKVSVKIGPHDGLASGYTVSFMTEQCAMSLCDMEFSFGSRNEISLNHNRAAKKSSRRADTPSLTNPQSE